MKSVSKFLIIALALMPGALYASPVATTAGSNLTAYNPNGGASNNNMWNTLTNPRGASDAGAPTADFGNCNALIMRCATPKCNGGGCADMVVAQSIVSGCVNSNASCKKYGNELIDYIAAQLVSTSTARANAATAAAATQQNNEQLDAIQAQMAQTQQLLAAQTDAMNALKSELDEQKQATAQAIADATANAAAANTVAPVPAQTTNSDVSSATTTPATTTTGDENTPTAAELAAMQAGIDAQLIERAKISGQILTQIENAQQSLETLRAAMKDAFTYAGCDDRGSNCTGPKRVAVFKDKANKFFDPYDNVLDELYEALFLAQTVGVDISNIYQYLNNSCQTWGKYMCTKPVYAVPDPTKANNNLYVWPRYERVNCPNGRSKPGAPICQGYTLSGDCSYGVIGSVKGNHECNIGQTIPPEDDTSCTMVELLNNMTTDGDNRVTYNYLYPEEGDMGNQIRVGCASSMLESSWLFRGKKQKANIDIDTLRRIVAQDAHPVSTRGINRSYTNNNAAAEQVKYCAIDENQYANLQRYVTLKGLPTKNICINEGKLNRSLGRNYIAHSESLLQMSIAQCDELKSKGQNSQPSYSQDLMRCFCYSGRDEKNKLIPVTENCDKDSSMLAQEQEEERVCKALGGTYTSKKQNAKSDDVGSCDCSNNRWDEDTERRCRYQFVSTNAPSITSGNYWDTPRNIEAFKYDATTQDAQKRACESQKYISKDFAGWHDDNNTCVCDTGTGIQYYDARYKTCVYNTQTRKVELK